MTHSLENYCTKWNIFQLYPYEGLGGKMISDGILLRFEPILFTGLNEHFKDRSLDLCEDP